MIVPMDPEALCAALSAELGRKRDRIAELEAKLDAAVAERDRWEARGEHRSGKHGLHPNPLCDWCSPSPDTDFELPPPTKVCDATMKATRVDPPPLDWDTDTDREGGK